MMWLRQDWGLPSMFTYVSYTKPVGFGIKKFQINWGEDPQKITGLHVIHEF